MGQVTYFNHACCPNLICTDCARQMEACPFGRHSWDGTQQNQRVMRMTGLFPDPPTHVPNAQRLAAAHQAAARTQDSCIDAWIQRIIPQAHRQEFGDTLRQYMNAGYALRDASQILLGELGITFLGDSDSSSSESDTSESQHLDDGRYTCGRCGPCPIL